METSELINEIAVALTGFQSSVGKVKKSAKNPFFKSKYATLSDILEVIQTPLVENDLSFVQFPTSEFGLTTRVMHKSGQWIQDTFYMKPAKNDPQAHGSVITYQRRYALGAIFALNIDDDDDANAASHKHTSKVDAKTNPKKDNELQEKIKYLLKEALKYEIISKEEHSNIYTKIPKMNDEKLNKAIAWINEKMYKPNINKEVNNA